MTTILEDELTRLASLPDAVRKQAKFDHIVALMQGEGANFSAGIYISVMSAFAIACINIGLDPIAVLRDLKIHSVKETKRILREQGIQPSGAPRGLGKLDS
jgi:hypothetical protein